MIIMNKSSLHKKALKKGIYLAAIVMLSLLIYFIFYSNSVSEGLAENLIRLHVVAESDSKEDQTLKFEVRDAIIEYMSEKFENTKNIFESRELIKNNLNNITQVAQNTIESSGKKYSVKASLGYYPFPTKQYGDIILPPGNYQALRVVIGSGKGANWWCVLFPPLCIVDVTYGTVSESVKEELKNTLTYDEYEIINSVKNEKDIPVKIRFKIVEFFQNSKLKFSGAISKLFNAKE